jgi:hypothetical protein
MDNSSVNKIGFWSGLATTAFAIIYIIPQQHNFLQDSRKYFPITWPSNRKTGSHSRHFSAACATQPILNSASVKMDILTTIFFYSKLRSCKLTPRTAKDVAATAKA